MIKNLQKNREVFGPLFSALKIRHPEGTRVLLARGGCFYFEIPPQNTTTTYTTHTTHTYFRNRDYRYSIVYSVNIGCFIIPIPFYRKKGGWIGLVSLKGLQFPLKNSLKIHPPLLPWVRAFSDSLTFFCRDFNAHSTSALFFNLT